jgi:hypothetical protein
MVLVDCRRSRNSKLKAALIPRALSQTLSFKPSVSELLVELVDLHHQLLTVVTSLVATGFTPSLKVRKQCCTKQTREQKAESECQYKRYDAFEYSGVQHKILTCLKNLPNVYGGHRKSVSPTAAFS